MIDDQPGHDLDPLIFARMFSPNRGGRALIGSPMRQCLSHEGRSTTPTVRGLRTGVIRPGTTILQENQKFLVGFFMKVARNSRSRH